MSDVPCRVAGTVYVKDANGSIEGGERETQPFSNRDVDEGGVSTAVEQCRDGLIVLRAPRGYSYVKDEFAALVDSSSKNLFRDLVSNRRKQNLFLFFDDGMKHSVRAAATLRTSQSRCLLGPKPRYIRIFMWKQNGVS